MSSPTFEHTPLTKIALSGGSFLGRLTGEERMDATAILDYFAPLKQWLDEQNKAGE